MNGAVLFLIFNRPDTTQQVFDAIRKAKPSRLYVAADGPRMGKPGEKENCEKTRLIATAIDWDCELKVLFRNQNLGCRLAVSQAIDWFFEAEESGIILEDDCLPSNSWFPFAQEMLERFENDERIMCISANHFHGDNHARDDSYFFSAYAHCWGWASWRRAWAHYDRDMGAWPMLRNKGFPAQISNGNRLIQQQWTHIFDIAHEGIQVDSWAYRWLFSCWAQNGLTVTPAKNLVINLGVGQDGTHTQSVNTAVAAIRNEELSFPLKHPACLVRDIDSDDWESVHVYGMSYRNIFKSWLRHLPFVGNVLASLRNTARRALLGMKRHQRK